MSCLWHFWKKMLRFAADWRICICIFVCNSHFHMASREKCFPTYVNFQSFHVNSLADFFCSLALNTKNQFSNCVVEPHWEVGRVCSCKSWVTYCPPNHWNTHLHSCQSNPFLSWNPICHMKKKNQTNKQENKNSAATEDCACFHSTLKADPFLALCPGFALLLTLFMLKSTNWCMELLVVVDMLKASCFPNSKLKFPL